MNLDKLISDFKIYNSAIGGLTNKRGTPRIMTEDYMDLYNKYFGKLTEISKDILHELGYKLDDSIRCGKYRIVDNRTGKESEVDCKSLPHFWQTKLVDYSPSESIGIPWVCDRFEILPNFKIIHNL